MTEHMAAAPYGPVEGQTGHRNGHNPRMLRTRVGTLNLLVAQNLKERSLLSVSSSATSVRYQRPLPAKRAGTYLGPHGDVGGGCFHQEGSRGH